MFSQFVQSLNGVTLLGGGDVEVADIHLALHHAPCLVAADGGADVAVEMGLPVTAVIGDMDSLSPQAKANVPAEALHDLSHEQDTTDFDKCLQRVTAPFLIGVGFLGGRLDHELAACSSLLAFAHQRVILIGAEDIIFAMPPRLALVLPVGMRFSLYPLVAVRGRSQGLRWPIDGLDLRPGGRLGTSNEVCGPVLVEADAPGLLVIMPKAGLAPVLAALSG